MLVRVSKLDVGALLLFQLGLKQLNLTVDPGDFGLLLVEDIVEFFFHFTLTLFGLLEHLQTQCLFLFVEVLDLLVQHFDVQLKLLLHLDVVANISLVLLQLLLVLLGRQINRLEGRREARLVEHVALGHIPAVRRV